jgi:hypothetical protein
LGARLRPRSKALWIENVSAVSEAIRRTIVGLVRLRRAGSLLIQAFEGSHFGMLALWILNDDEVAGCER